MLTISAIAVEAIVVKATLPWTSVDEVCDVLALVVGITVNSLKVAVTDVTDLFPERNRMHISSIIASSNTQKNNNWNIHASINFMHGYNEDGIKNSNIWIQITVEKWSKTEMFSYMYILYTRKYSSPFNFRPSHLFCQRANLRLGEFQGPKLSFFKQTYVMVKFKMWRNRM